MYRGCEVDEEEMGSTHASVIALTQRNSASIKATWVVVEEPQNIREAKRHVMTKYA
jgi:hypothetical protein